MTLKWNTEPLFDDDGTEWMDRHPNYSRKDDEYDDRLWDAMFDLWLYTAAVIVWLALLLA